MEFCCEKLKQAIKSELVIFFQGSSSPQYHQPLPRTFAIRGPCNMVNDGDDCFDDMTPEINISHCPFCGKRLIQFEVANA